MCHGRCDGQRMADACRVVAGDRRDSHTRLGARLSFERNGQKPGRLVHDEHRVVFVDDLKLTENSDSAWVPRASRSIRPKTDGVARGQECAGLFQAYFFFVDENLASLECQGGTAPRAQPLGECEVPIEANSGVFGVTAQESRVIPMIESSGHRVIEIPDPMTRCSNDPIQMTRRRMTPITSR